MSNITRGANSHRARLILAALIAILVLSTISPCLWLYESSAVGAQDYRQLFRNYIKTEYLTTYFSPGEVQPGEEFYFVCQAGITILKDADLPIAVQGSYEVVALMPDGEEIVLGGGSDSFGPASLKAGDLLQFDKSIPLAFPAGTPPGSYQVYVRAIEVTPPELWLAWQFMSPRVALMGTVELGAAEPEPAPAVDPRPIALWQTPDEDAAQAGTQVNPLCSSAGSKEVAYWAIVAGNGDAACVNASVFLSGSTTDYQYQVPLQRVDDLSTGIAELRAACEAGLVTFAEGFSFEGVLDWLEVSRAEVWMGSASLGHRQPAGDYAVTASSLGLDGSDYGSLENTFQYVPVCCIEVDFWQMSYTAVKVGAEEWSLGDREFGTPASTVRNIGNTDVYLGIRQTDMGFGRNSKGDWNVVFGARLGGDPSGTIHYVPYEDAALPHKLEMGSAEELSFSIYIKRGTSGLTYSGDMMLVVSMSPL